MQPHSRRKAKAEVTAAVERAYREALNKHGSLQGGMARWEHHLREECEEAIVEMRHYRHIQTKYTSYHPRILNRTRAKMFEELAQVAQLAENMMLMLMLETETLQEDTWQAKSSSSKADNGAVKRKGLSLISSQSKEG